MNVFNCFRRHLPSVRMMLMQWIQLVSTCWLMGSQTPACHWWWTESLRQTLAETSSRSTPSHSTVQTGNEWRQWCVLSTCLLWSRECHVSRSNKFLCCILANRDKINFSVGYNRIASLGTSECEEDKINKRIKTMRNLLSLLVQF